MTDHLDLDDPRMRAASFEARALLSSAGQVQDADAAMVRMLGRPRDAIVGTSFVRYVAEEDRALFRRALLRAEPGRRWRFRLRHGDHGHDVLATLARPSPDHDSVAMAVLAGDDAAHLRRRADELARGNAAKQAVIDSLQAVLVPQPRPVPGLDVAVRHAARDAQSATSGDALDVVPLRDGRCHLALVDVTGHGIAHSAQALLLVQTLRVLALGGTSVDDLFAAALPLVRAQDGELTAAGVLGSYDPTSGRLRLVGAGAPPAIVCRADGGLQPVELHGAPFGFDVGPAPRPVDVHLALGDTVLLVTDGVLARRPDLWLERVRHHLADAATEPLDRLAGQLLRDAVDTGTDDDATVVGLRRTVGGPVLPRADVAGFAMALDALVDVPPARLALRRWLTTHAVAPPLVDDVVLVMSELCTNAVQVARTEVSVTARIDGDAVVLEVRDDGPGLPPAERAQLMDARGAPDRTRGLFLVAEVADDVFVASDGSGTVIRATCHGDMAGDAWHRRGD